MYLIQVHKYNLHIKYRAQIYYRKQLNLVLDRFWTGLDEKRDGDNDKKLVEELWLCD